MRDFCQERCKIADNAVTPDRKLLEQRSGVKPGFTSLKNMSVQTIHIFAKNALNISRTDGGALTQGNPISNAVNGDAYSWENPSDVAITFGTADTTITFNDADGILSDDPFNNADVIDQTLAAPVTVNGVTYNPSATTVRWQNPAPVNVENEYEVSVYSASGTVYHMVGVSITQGYTTTVVGVMFKGATPPPGTTLFYHQGSSTYSGSGQTLPIPTVTCFVAGTRIETTTGPRAIETLCAGDMVLTLDGGARPIRWIGRSRVDGFGPHAPIRIAAGAFGNLRDLDVSPNHRMYLYSSKAELYLGCNEVLVAAKFLLNGDSVRRALVRRADYIHLMLDQHDMVFAEGVASESLFTGSGAMNSLGSTAQAELLAIFPQLKLREQVLCRRSLTKAEAHLLFPASATYPGLRLADIAPTLRIAA
ncbi:MAG: Hint domain protein [Cypionkella sp.]|nr:Hint domain protein [Cypionkella sp.]